MTHTEIVNKVKSILNEHGEVDAVSIGEDRVLLEDYIESAIPDAVIMLANKGYAVNTCGDVPNLNDESNIILPNDFISLLSVKFKSWRRIVTKITELGSPEYVMAMNEYTGPNVNTPMCYKTQGLLVCLPSSSGSELLFEYNKVYDKDEGLYAEPKEATAVCYMTAALVLGMFGDDQGKQRLSDISTNMLQ